MSVMVMSDAEIVTEELANCATIVDLKSCSNTARSALTPSIVPSKETCPVTTVLVLPWTQDPLSVLTTMGAAQSLQTPYDPYVPAAQGTHASLAALGSSPTPQSLAETHGTPLSHTCDSVSLLAAAHAAPLFSAA
jgi:hypothetical protein